MDGKKRYNPRRRIEEVSMELGKLGILGLLDGCASAETRGLAQEIERLGYGALWFPHQTGREAFSFASYLLSQTDELIVGTGVAIAFAYEPIIAASAARTLGEIFGDRFILGLGVSNKAYNSQRGFGYERPVAFMREYLAKMKNAPYEAPKPPQEAPVVIAAMMPKMLELAASETRGTLTYLTTTEQIARYRSTIGPHPWICAVQLVMLETDAANARARARGYLQLYLGIEHYPHRWGGLGFDEGDFANGGSDRLIDAVVAWGDEGKIRQRIADQFKAGATHVCMIPLDPRGGVRPDRRAIEALAVR
jgi:probable F420-dependent oxidoreductase